MGRIYREVKDFNDYTKSMDLALKPFTPLFDITFADTNIKGKSKIIFFFLKPEQSTRDTFGFDREILGIFFRYPEIHTRLFEQIDTILSEFRSRLDQMVCVLISESDKIAEEIKQFPVLDSNRICIIPIPISRLVEKKIDAAELKKIFQDNMYHRDLFAVESPIQNSRAFFGRDEIVITFIDRIKNNQNSGIFGLRKIGKTSVLFAIQRSINSNDNGRFIYYDCSNPAFYGSHWWDCLKILLLDILKQTNSLPIDSLEKMNKESASRIFSDSIIDVISRVPEHRLILALDEIEWISFKISPKEHWNSEFLPFWQTMRAIHQNTNGSFTFIISGVNPKCIEEESIGGYDNPLFALIKPHFLKPFDDQSTRTMIRTLGKYMGIKFEYDFYTALIESYGGHPFLVRHACSKISELMPDRPITITKNNFDTYKNQINLSLQRYIKQILNVLAVWYPEEYEMVVLLSKRQIDKVKDHLKQQPEFLEHLVGYGLVVISGGEPKLSLLILSSHLKKDKNKDVIQAANTNNIEEDIEDIRVEISRRRNSIELWLHQLIKNGLRFKHGNRCMDKILSSLSQERRSVLSRYGYDAIFDELYLSELVTILNKNWDSFQNWFNQDLKDVETWLNTINKLRIDAHARGIKADDLSYLRFCFSRLEEIKDR